MISKKEYQKIISQLPKGTVAKAAVKFKVTRQAVYHALKSGNVEVTAGVIQVARQLREESQRAKENVKELIDSL